MLDADISLTQQGHKPPGWLAGTCRPPPDGVGATLNKVILHRVATATIRALLERAAAALISRAPEPGRSNGAPPGPAAAMAKLPLMTDPQSRPDADSPGRPRAAGAYVRIRCRAAFEWVPPRVGLSLDGTVALCRDGTTQQCPSGASHLRGAPLADLHAVRRARSLVRRAFAGPPRAFAPGAAGNTAAWG